MSTREPRLRSNRACCGPRSFLLIVLALAGCSERQREPTATVAVDVSALDQARALIHVDQLHALGIDGNGVTVAMLDTGVDTTHPDLIDSIVDEACFCGSNCCPNGMSTQSGAGAAVDDNGHGTHLAGVITSNGTQSPRGVAPAANVVAVKVLDSQATFCCMSDLLAGLQWVETQHPEVKLINMSLGGSTLYDTACDSATPELVALSSEIATLRGKGVLVVASTGNQGSPTSVTPPACLADVLSVGAVWDEDLGAQAVFCNEPVTKPDLVGCFSNAGALTDVLAPGARITSTWLLDSARGRVGTSEAAAVASGCLADLLQAAPSSTPAQLERALEHTGKSLVDPKNGMSYPRIDCFLALDALTPGVLDAGSLFEIDAALDAALDAGTQPDSAVAHTEDASLLDASETLDAAATSDAARPAADGGVHDGGAPDAAVPRRDAGQARDAALPDGALDAPLTRAERLVDDQAGGCTVTPGRSPHTHAANAWFVSLTLLGFGSHWRRRKRTAEPPRP